MNEREVITMTEIMTIITEAEANGKSVVITDEDGYFGLERVWGSTTQWFAVGEFGWYYSNEDIAKLTVLEIIELDSTSTIMIKTDIEG
jgi:hypothetical protein